ncbi:uncharacterized protein LODBEIA_P15070 [Lodderomyces beijingensis]|uniref:Transcription activator GCR1-like domain-containing protein n=1 Tax=Lodderomyces beijingensis TaxID=1775926 RepID=A0ABP0ZGI6_9ASCO
MDELRPETLRSITALLNQDLDYLLGQKQRVEIENLKSELRVAQEALAFKNELLKRQDEEIQRLRRHLEQSTTPLSLPLPLPLSSSPSKPSLAIHTVDEVKDARKARSVIDEIHFAPTQYSDTEEEGASIFCVSSPVKAEDPGESGFAKPRRWPTNASPKRKLSPTRVKLSPKNKKIPRLAGVEPNLCTVKLEELGELESALLSKSRELRERDKVKNIKNEFFDEVEVIGDSQEKDGKGSPVLGSGSSPSLPRLAPISISIPGHLSTIIQRRQYLNEVYAEKFKCDPDFKINLTEHPIKLIGWDFTDFVKNANYKPGELTQLIQRNNIMSEKKFNDYKNFYKVGENVSFEDKVSQIFDKFESPPGLMKSDFPDTQELQERRNIIKERQARRIERRIESCVVVEDGKQIGEHVFNLEILNKYVVSNRWYKEQ